MSLLSMMILETAEHGIFDISDPRMWVFFSLALLVAIVIWKKLPSLAGKALDERAGEIRKELEHARQLREEAQELLASYERRQREAEKEAEAIIAQAKHEATIFAKEARTNLEDVLQRRAAAAARKIEQAQARASADVRAHAAALAVETTRLALEKSLSKPAHSKLISNSISELGERL